MISKHTYHPHVAAGRCYDSAAWKMGNKETMREAWTTAPVGRFAQAAGVVFNILKSPGICLTYF
jgi:hypothetical protein